MPTPPASPLNISYCRTKDGSAIWRLLSPRSHPTEWVVSRRFQNTQVKGATSAKDRSKLAAGAMLLTAAPSFAQIGVDVGPGGVSVGIGRDRDRDYRRDRVHREGDRYERRRYGCRTIVERKRT